MLPDQRQTGLDLLDDALSIRHPGGYASGEEVYTLAIHLAVVCGDSVPRTATARKLQQRVAVYQTCAERPFDLRARNRNGMEIIQSTPRNRNVAANQCRFEIAK